MSCVGRTACPAPMPPLPGPQSLTRSTNANTRSVVSLSKTTVHTHTHTHKQLCCLVLAHMSRHRQQVTIACRFSVELSFARDGIVVYSFAGVAWCGVVWRGLFCRLSHLV